MNKSIRFCIFVRVKPNDNQTNHLMQKQRRVTRFSELAGLYFPRCSTAKNAVRCLSRWIGGCTPLTEELSATGYAPYNHQLLTPKQYYIITKHLGDPFEE